MSSPDVHPARMYSDTVSESSSPVSERGGHRFDDQTSGSAREKEVEDEDEPRGYSTGSDSALENAGNRSFDLTETSLPELRESFASSGGLTWADVGSSAENGTSRGKKRSYGGASLLPMSMQQIQPVKRRRKESAIPSIAKDMAKRLGVAPVEESDKMILETEHIINRPYAAEALHEGSEIALEAALPVATESLCRAWQNHRKQQMQDIDMADDVVITIGPSEDAPPFQKAEFIAPLLLQLHHPPAATGKQAFALSRNFPSSLNTSLLDSTQPPFKPTSLPKVLTDWLEEHHNAYAVAAINLQLHQPDPTANENYWDVILYLVLRGRIVDAINILKKSNFQYARTARDDGQGQYGYSGVQLKNIGIVIDRATGTLRGCPSLIDGNWEVVGNDWKVFRKQVESAASDLALFAEGRDRDQEPLGQNFEAPNFGIRSTKNILSQSTRRAESQVPWTVYQNLKTLYGILLGGTAEIVSSSQDWVEATVALTVWWDGENDDEEIAVGSNPSPRRSFKRSRDGGHRTVDINPTAAYRQRLAYAFERVTDEEDDDLFQINSNDDVQVGLAAVFEGDVEGAIGLLLGWSLPVASAVAEVASLGGWFASSTTPMVDDFNESDLMVLSYGQKERNWSSDDILVQYAEQLFEKGVLQGFRVPQEGWELSTQLLGRLNDESVARTKIRELFQRLPLTSDRRADNVISLCRSYGMEAEASSIAEVQILSNEQVNPMLTKYSDTPLPSPKARTDMAQPLCTTLAPTGPKR